MGEINRAITYKNQQKQPKRVEANVEKYFEINLHGFCIAVRQFKYVSDIRRTLLR